MQRVMIIGGPGSGKSTLARTMGDRLNLPVFHMDHIHWKPGWVERDQAAKIKLVHDVIAQEVWVFEGGHSATNADRLARSDVLIWLDVPVGLRIWRVVRRSLRDLGRTRPDLQEDCPERLSMLPEFLRFIWTTRHSARAKSQQVFDAADIPKHRFRTLAEVKTYLETLT